MRIQIRITETHVLAFDFATIAVAENAFAAIRALPPPVYADEVEPYIAQVSKAAGGEALAV